MPEITQMLNVVQLVNILMLSRHNAYLAEVVLCRLQVDGQHISWQKWQMRITFNYKEVR